MATGLIGAGCLGRGDSGTRVLTSLPDRAVAELLDALHLERVEIVRPLPRPDPWLALDRGVRADMVLGGPWWTYALRLGDVGVGARRGADHRATSWVVLRPTAVGLWVDDTASRKTAGGASFWSLAAEEALSGRLGWADPRSDGPLLAAAASHLARDWSAGYADLVRWSALAQPARDLPLGGPRRGLVAARWGDAFSAPSEEGFGFLPCPECAPWVQGGAVLPGARDAGSLHAALEALASPGQGKRVETDGDERFPRSALGLSLLSDLLHATLVAAQPELHQAWAALREIRVHESDAASRAQHSVVQPPPWPPASVELLKSKPRAQALLSELAAQVTSSAGRRDWLRAQFEHDTGLLDGSVLAGLAACDDGRLGDEPRFRTWLRAEWRAWARQRYRRAARLAEGKVGHA